jgi:hypothetical protein
MCGQDEGMQNRVKGSNMCTPSDYSLADVSFELAVDRDTQGERAWAVEECRCPTGYVGLSCEDCAPGYDRSGGGLYLGTCELTESQCNAAGSVHLEPVNGKCQCKVRLRKCTGMRAPCHELSHESVGRTISDTGECRTVPFLRHCCLTPIISTPTQLMLYCWCSCVN